MPHSHTLRFLTAALIVLMTSAAPGQPQRTFVSAQSGNDASPCTVGAPCRTFTRAHEVVAPGGDIVALDSGGYGAFVILKSVNVMAVPGAVAGITALTSSAIRINSPLINVSLKNLNLTGLGGINGINATAFRGLHVENCVIRGFTDGIRLLPTGDSWVQMRDVHIALCTGEAVDMAGPVQGVLEVQVDRCSFLDNYVAFNSAYTVNSVVRDTLFQANDTAVFTALATSNVFLQNCTLTGNYVALYGGGAPDTSITIGGCTLTGNTFAALSGGGADILSFGNNYVLHNTSNDLFPFTAAMR